MADENRQHITVRLEPELIDRVERIARSQERSRSKMIELLLRESVERFEAAHSPPKAGKK